MMSNVRIVSVYMFVTAGICLLTIGGPIASKQRRYLPLLANSGPFRSGFLSTSPKEEQTRMAEQVFAADSFDNGRLYIYVARDPDPVKFPSGLSNNDHMSSFLTGKEWEALFLDELKCPDRFSISSGDSEVYGARFAAALHNYPMLGRISDMYIYVCYTRDEVRQLREECLRAQRLTSNPKAAEGLVKLLQACDEALINGSGLLFVPD